MIDLNGVGLRSRVVTSSSLLGYGAPRGRFALYGLSPIAQWVPLEKFGAVTTRTLTLAPRDGHFTLREDWRPAELPQLMRRYAQALRRVDAGWLNAFGWCNIGVEAYFRDYFPKTARLNRIVSLGCAMRGFNYPSSPAPGYVLSTTAVNTSGLGRMPSAWAVRSGWRRTGPTLSVRCAASRFSDSSDAWRRMTQTHEALGRDLVTA